MVEVLQKAEPKFKIYPLKTILYASEQDKIPLQVANAGLSDARNVEITLEGIEVIQPEKTVIPYLSQSSIAVVDFDVKAPNKTGAVCVVAGINYTYFDGERWVDRTDVLHFNLTVEKIGEGIDFSFGRDELRRDEKGVLELSVMNDYRYPVRGLEVVISEPKGIDFSASRFLAGYLSPGEVRVIRIPYSVDENAGSGIRDVEIVAKYTLLTSKIEEKEITRFVKIRIKEDPEMEVTNRPVVVYYGENVVKLEVINIGGDAKNIHFKLNPSPGIKLKMPEAYIAELRHGNKANISFRVDVDSDVIAGNEYRVDLNYKAEKMNGEEVYDTCYAYLIVEEKSWIEKNFMAIALLAVTVVSLIAIRRIRKIKK